VSHAISVNPSNTVKGQNNDEICDPTKASALNLSSDRVLDFQQKKSKK
jgi:hypothetical protein